MDHRALSGHRPVEERLALGGVLVLIVASVLWYGGVPTIAWTSLAIATFVLLGAVSSLRLRNTGRWLWHPVLAPALTFGGLVFLQWLHPFTINRSLTLDGFLQLASYGAFFYVALIAFQHSSNVLRAVRVLRGFAALLAAEAILQIFTGNGYIYWIRDARYATPAGPFIYHNHFAGWMELIFPPLFLLAIRHARRHKMELPVRLRLVLVPVLIVIAVIASLSRGGLIAVVVEFVLLLWVERHALFRSRRNLQGTAAVLAVFLFLMPLMNWSPVQHRLSSLRNHDTSFLDRISVSRTALEIWNHHRWIGTGFNTFQTAYPSFQTIDTGHTWLAAHDEWAQILSETGLIGFLAVLAFVILSFRSALQSSYDPKSDLATIRTGTLISSSVFLLHCCGDFLFHAPADAFLFLLLVAILIAPGIKPTPFVEAPVSDSHHRRTSIRTA